MDPKYVLGSGLPSDDVDKLTAQIQSVARRMSCDQMLDLADVLHDLIRERQLEARSWRPAKVQADAH